MRHVIVFPALLMLVLPGLLPAQYVSRRRGPAAATATSGPYNGPAVTFHGTVKVLSKKELIVDLDKAQPTDDQQSLTFRLSKKTKFVRDDQEIKPNEIAVGAHISVDATREGDLKFSALTVIAAAPAAKPGAN